MTSSNISDCERVSQRLRQRVQWSTTNNLELIVSKCEIMTHSHKANNISYDYVTDKKYSKDQLILPI